MTTEKKTAVLVLAAGKGTRMQSNLSKVLHPLAGIPIIQHLINTIIDLAPEEVIFVIGPGMESVARAVAPYPTVIQLSQLGTGCAIATARPYLLGFEGDILVLYGDTPLVSVSSLKSMLGKLRESPQTVAISLGFLLKNPDGYGHLVTASDGRLVAVIEHYEEISTQHDIYLCNSGVIAIRGQYIFNLIDQISSTNLREEYYLTDIIALAQSHGLICTYNEGKGQELLGINTQYDLSLAESLVQERLRDTALSSGVTLIDPRTVYFCSDTKIGCNVLIHPYVVFGPGVIIEEHVEICSFCHLEQTTISSGARIGPYARLRPGTKIGKDVHIGNFVEIKQALIEQNTKVNHLSYIGDGHVGANSNIGAGTIFCNYDGHKKSFTDIGANAFIGSNTALVAPVKIGQGAVIGAGSVITKDVSPNALAIARGTQTEFQNWNNTDRETLESKPNCRKF